MQNITIRGVQAGDLDRIAEIEALCFPTAEAAPREAFAERILTFPDCFLVAQVHENLVGFINGCVTNSPVIYDELFHDTRHHLPDGRNLTVFGLDVVPAYRNQGIATRLMNGFIQSAKAAGRENVILTCKAHLVSYYQSFGYVNNGISASSHGGAEWFDMTLPLRLHRDFSTKKRS